MTIEERAEAAIKAKYPKLQPSDQFKEFFTEGFEAGATEQQALSEARIKELEEALKIAVLYIPVENYTTLELINKALNNQQQ